MNFPFESDFWGKKNPLYGKHVKNMMKTDIREHEGGYEVDIDLPGFKKMKSASSWRRVSDSVCF